MSARAQLIEDRGAAAADAEFFRTSQFLEAEGATHTLRIELDEGGEGPRQLLAPLIVRPIGDGSERDAISPYGYPGLVPPASERTSSRYAGQTAPAVALDPAAIDFSATGLVSVFLRHTLGPPSLTGATERITVQIADPAAPPKSRPSDRRQIRRNQEAGYELELIPGAETTPEQRAAFLELYDATMRRTEAARHYFFGAAYFDSILAVPRTWLALAHAPGGEPAAASIATVSDGFLHYYLSGSSDLHLGDSPMKNVLARLIEHAAELGLPLNLGGGLSPGDPLEEFKRGFANRAEPWFSSELVCDPARYATLSAGHEAGAFFPAYRAPS